MEETNKKLVNAAALKAALAAVKTKMPKVATATVPGLVKPGVGLSIDADGKLNYSGDAADVSLAAAKKYTDDKIADLVGGAPETLDTLAELADALGKDANLAATLAAQIGNKADKTTVTAQAERIAALEAAGYTTEAALLAKYPNLAADLGQFVTATELDALAMTEADAAAMVAEVFG